MANQRNKRRSIWAFPRLPYYRLAGCLRSCWRRLERHSRRESQETRPRGRPENQYLKSLVLENILKTEQVHIKGSLSHQNLTDSSCKNLRKNWLAHINNVICFNFSINNKFQLLAITTVPQKKKKVFYGKLWHTKGQIMIITTHRHCSSGVGLFFPNLFIFFLAFIPLSSLISIRNGLNNIFKHSFVL